MDYLKKLKRVMSLEEISNDNLFKATLSAVGRMQKDFTKVGAIKSASKKYEVPQKDIKRLVDKLGVESKRSQMQKSNPLFKEQAINELTFARRMSQKD